MLTAADQLTLVALELLISSGKSPFPRHWCGDILKEIIDSLSVTLIEITGETYQRTDWQPWPPAQGSRTASSC